MKKSASLICLVLGAVAIHAQPYALNVIPKGLTTTTLTNSALRDDGGSIISTNAHYTFNGSSAVINWGNGSGDLYFRRLAVGGVYTSGFSDLMTIRYGGNVGIGNTNPLQKLDVNGNARLRSVPTLAGDFLMTGFLESGSNDISFRKLAFTGSSSDVLLGNGSWGSLPAASSLPGNYCSGTPNALTGEFEIPLHDNNYHFSNAGSAVSSNNVGIGTACGSSLNARLVVSNPVMPMGVDAVTSSGGAANIGLRGRASGAVTSIGVSGEANGAITTFNTGVNGYASNGTQADYGGKFLADGTNASPNYGVHTSATGAAAGSYALYAANGTAGGGGSNHWAGYFNGDVNINGTGYITAGVWSVSDRRYKENVKKLESVNDKLQRLSGYTYTFKTAEYKDKNFDSKEQIGFIAQELKEVFPQLVKEDKDGYMAVNYQGMIPVLLEAVKEQKREIEELKAMVKNNAGIAASVHNVQLNNGQSIVLDQNIPNPFAEQTIINYVLNETVQKAQILFYNSEGKLINSSNLKAVPGKGALNVFANDLSNGIYTYTLVVDGKVIDTKRMVKEN